MDQVGNPDVFSRSGEPTVTGEHAADPRLPRPGVRRARGHLPARPSPRKPAKYVFIYNTYGIYFKSILIRLKPAMVMLKDYFFLNYYDVNSISGRILLLHFFLMVLFFSRLVVVSISYYIVGYFFVLSR